MPQGPAREPFQTTEPTLWGVLNHEGPRRRTTVFRSFRYNLPANSIRLWKQKSTGGFKKGFKVRPTAQRGYPRYADFAKITLNSEKRCKKMGLNTRGGGDRFVHPKKMRGSRCAAGNGGLTAILLKFSPKQSKLHTKKKRFKSQGKDWTRIGARSEGETECVLCEVG